MNLVSTYINSVILSAIIVVTATPILYGLKQRGVHPILAYAITLLVILSFFIAVVVFVILAINQFIESVPTYAEQLESMFNSISEFIRSLGISEDIKLEAITQILDPGKILGLIVNFFAGLAGGLSDIFLVVLIVIFLLVDALGVPDKIAPYIQAGDRTVTRISAFGADVRRYIVVTTIVGLATGVLDTIFFIIMGDELDLSLFIVVFSVIFWSAVLGPFGAILSVPMTMAFKSLILEPDESNRWLADLMSAGPHDRSAEIESTATEDVVVGEES